jgi:O-antigen biosynthesis protein
MPALGTSFSNQTKLTINQNTMTNPQVSESAVNVPQSQYVWERCLDIKSASEGNYHAYFNPQLLDVLAHPPRRLLDIGCASGILGKYVKDTTPGAHVTGIEPNQAAANAAKANIDVALCGKFEDFDLVKEGIPHGSIDTVVAADVLEHMYDPWHTLVNLKPYLSKDAQLIISIPNTRHINLIARLADGGLWSYAERGLLDITHIRFFTLKEMAAMLEQTGYRLEAVRHFIDPSFQEFYEAAKDKPEINIRVGRLALEGVSKQDLTELCTWQFFMRARPVWA